MGCCGVSLPNPSERFTTDHADQAEGGRSSQDSQVSWIFCSAVDSSKIKVAPRLMALEMLVRFESLFRGFGVLWRIKEY